MAAIALSTGPVEPSTAPVELSTTAIALSTGPVEPSTAAIASARMGLWDAETAKTLAFMEKAWLVLVNAVFMLAAFKHRTRRRGSLVWLISLRWAGLAARLHQRDKFGEGQAQAETDLGDDAHRGVGFSLLDLPDGFRGDLAVFRQAIPAHPCGYPDFRQLARQPGADAFGVIIRPMLTNWCIFHARG